eukprot:767693-Hanusia_phi.AAC.4
MAGSARMADEDFQRKKGGRDIKCEGGGRKSNSEEREEREGAGGEVTIAASEGVVLSLVSGQEHVRNHGNAASKRQQAPQVLSSIVPGSDFFVLLLRASQKAGIRASCGRTRSEVKRCRKGKDWSKEGREELGIRPWTGKTSRGQQEGRRAGVERGKEERRGEEGRREARRGGEEERRAEERRRGGEEERRRCRGREEYLLSLVFRLCLSCLAAERIWLKIWAKSISMLTSRSSEGKTGNFNHRFRFSLPFDVADLELTPEPPVCLFSLSLLAPAKMTRKLVYLEPFFHLLSILSWR